MQLESYSKSELENSSKRITKTLFEREDFKLATAENEGEEPFSFASEVIKNVIHFYFCLEGSAVFEFGAQYSREIQKHQNYFFYNPEKDLPFQLKLSSKTKMVFANLGRARKQNSVRCQH